MVLSAPAPAEPLRALIIGTGSIGRRHIANLRILEPSARFALVRDGAREDEYSREIGAERFASLDDAIAWRPDIAVVATPSDRHYEALAPLLRAGVATFVEKPVVMSAEHADRLDALGRLPPTQTGCVLRFLPAVRRLKSWLDEGRCGNIVRASFEAGQYLPDWRPAQDYRQSYSADAARGGGVILDLVHEIDLALFLFGDAELLHAARTKASSLDIACEDAALLTLRAPGGVLIGIALDYVSRRPVRRIEIVGDEGTARLDFVGKTLILDEVTCEGFDLDEAYRSELAELIAAARTGAPTSLPIAEGLRATRLAIAARSMA
jgi:predicted dehydrogenase